MNKLGFPGARLKTARKVAGFKFALDFCKKYNISQATYSFHENGKRQINAKTAEKYAELLGVNAAWLLTGQGNPYDVQEKEKPPLPHDAFMELLKDQENQSSYGLLDSPAEYVDHVNIKMMSRIILDMVNILNKINFKLTNDQLTKRACEIYEDITKSSDDIKEQYIMLPLALTTFQRQCQELKKIKQEKKNIAVDKGIR